MLRVLSIFPTSNAYFSHADVQDWRGLQACAAVIWEELHPFLFRGVSVVARSARMRSSRTGDGSSVGF